MTSMYIRGLIFFFFFALESYILSKWLSGIIAIKTIYCDSAFARNIVLSKRVPPAV